MKCKDRMFYSEEGAKGNDHMEFSSVRFKVKNDLIFWELDEITELKMIVKERVMYYNFIFKHLALAN
jgi:hypothetical protein